MHQHINMEDAGTMQMMLFSSSPLTPWTNIERRRWGRGQWWRRRSCYTTEAPATALPPCWHSHICKSSHPMCAWCCTIVPSLSFHLLPSMYFIPSLSIWYMWGCILHNMVAPSTLMLQYMYTVYTIHNTPVFHQFCRHIVCPKLPIWHHLLKKGNWIKEIRVLARKEVENMELLHKGVPLVFMMNVLGWSSTWVESLHS